MIFRPELVKQILAGKKTMTRRPVKPGELACRYKPGRVYGVQLGRGRPTHMTGEEPLRITILEVRQEHLGEITLPDARREGFRTTQEFKDYWRGLYGTFDLELPVWVIGFARGDVTDRPRLLAARPGGPGGDYTDNPARAARDEGEAVPQQTQERFSRRAAERDDLLRASRIGRALSAIDEIAQHATGRERKRLRAAANQIRALDSGKEAA